MKIKKQIKDIDPNKPKGKRGRPKGVTLPPRDAKSIIKDPVIEPFWIRLEEKSFVLLKGDEQAPWGYFTTLPSCLKRLVGIKLQEGEKEFTLKEYVNQFQASVDELTRVFKLE